MLNFIEVKHPFYRTLEARIGDKKVGRVDFELDIMIDKIRLIMVYVEKDYRRQGIATKMLKYLENKYKQEILWNGKTKDGESLYKAYYSDLK
jgi:GNAT superfamily N-acetyltransferase